MKKLFFLLLLLFLSSEIVLAQRTLIIKKSLGKRRYEFVEHEKMKLKLHNSGEILRGSWQHYDDSSIVVGSDVVKLNNIRWIDISKKESGVWILRKGQDLLLITGAAFLTVSQVNSLIDTGEITKDKTVYRVGGALLAGGIFCTILDRILLQRKLRINKGKYRISVIGYGPGG